jgi:hypothetical protein
MKKITKFAFLIIFGSLMIFGAQSCQKYDDGPLISLSSRTSRVANNWKVDNYKVNDVDYTSLVADYKETFTTDHNYSYTWGILGGTGTWAFENDYAEVRITGTDNLASQTLYILKLEQKQFWYYIMDGSDKKEYHMIQQ